MLCFVLAAHPAVHGLWTSSIQIGDVVLARSAQVMLSATKAGAVMPGVFGQLGGRAGTRHTR